MLSILLLLSAPVQSVTPSASAVPRPSAIGRNLFSPLPDCNNRATPVADPTAPGAGLAWREGDQPVWLYRLLERRVNGCSAPIVVLDRIPGSAAVGREAIPAGAVGPPRP